MTVLEFIDSFDFNNPNWESLPEDFHSFDFDTLAPRQIITYHSIKTLWEIYQPKKPESRSRVWKSPNGYIYLVSWSNASLLRIMAVNWMQWLKTIKGGSSAHSVHRLGWKYLDRLEAQLLDCLRSAIANQEEGYARPGTSKYLEFIGFAQASLKEAKGDFQRSKQDGILPSIPGSSLTNLGIDLRNWHEALKQSVISKPHEKLQEVTGDYRKVSIHSFNYPPVDQLDPANLTYEQFIELINKTDWQLRRLVESLELKLNHDQKWYQVEKARISSKLAKK